MDCSPSSSSVHGIFQARILEQVAMSYSKGASPSKELQADSLPLSHQESLFMRRGKCKCKILEMHWKLGDQ